LGGRQISEFKASLVYSYTEKPCLEKNKTKQNKNNNNNKNKKA
jgi:hypothetical protein